LSAPLSESERDYVLQPKVARNELPWVIHSDASQPQRGCGWRCTRMRRNPVGVGDFIGPGSQGSAARNPGLNAVAPLGQTGMIMRAQPVNAPDLTKDCPDAKKLVTEDCIRPVMP